MFEDVFKWEDIVPKAEEEEELVEDDGCEDDCGEECSKDCNDANG